MTAVREIPLYTSIPPTIRRTAEGIEHGEDYQRECIDSWIAAGFRVVSINSADEIAQLLSKYKQVHFVESGTGDARTGIHTFISTIVDKGEPIAGIINADCYLLNCGSMAERMYHAAVESIVLLRRLNINSKSLRPSGNKCTGFDGFLFDTKFLSSLDALGDWAIGTPWWDYWFPAVMHLAGARIRMFDAPVLFHLDHEQRWSLEDLNMGAAIYRKELIECTRRALKGELLSQSATVCGIDILDSTFEPMQLLGRTVEWFYRQAEIIPLRNGNLPEDFLSRVLRALENSQEISLQHQLDTVTFSWWLRSKRGAVRRLRDRLRKRFLGSSLPPIR